MQSGEQTFPRFVLFVNILLIETVQTIDNETKIRTLKQIKRIYLYEISVSL